MASFSGAGDGRSDRSAHADGGLSGLGDFGKQRTKSDLNLT